MLRSTVRKCTCVNGEYVAKMVRQWKKKESVQQSYLTLVENTGLDESKVYI